MPPTGPGAAIGVEDLAAAVRGGDLVRAETILAQLSRPLEPAGLRAAAELRLCQHRWAEAAEFLSQAQPLDVPGQCQRRLARNLAELAERRPLVHQILLSSPTQTRCRVVAADEGQLSIAQQDRPDHYQVLSVDGKPKQSLDVTLQQIEASLIAGRSFALAGIGDGYLLGALARRRWGPFANLGVELPLVIVEPDAEVVLHALMIHDYTGPDGPIQRASCLWCLGPTWPEQVRETLLGDPGLPFPTAILPVGRWGGQILDFLAIVQKELDAQVAQLVAQIHQRYAQRDAGELAALLGPNPPRAPRALLLTSRFTTVLQYSTQDVATALEQEGWQTLVAIEPTMHHGVTRPWVAQLVAQFEPDLVFAIDHLRSKLSGLFPPELPFVAWIQDDLPHLASAKAGASIGRRDFVLTCAAHAYHNNFGYPLRQCLYMGKLTRAPRLPAHWENDGEDLAFVSHASRTPEAITQELVGWIASPASLQETLRLTCRRMIQEYEAGRCLHVYEQVRRLLRQAGEECGVPPLDAALLNQIVFRLFNSLNNALYRQQALGWVAQVADKLDLRLGLYGQGWESHPTLGRFARGPIVYGPELEELTRRTKINLQIVPFSCLHQRLLDGLVAGGFFLVRRHPVDVLALQLGEFFTAHVDPAARTMGQAHAGLAPALAAQLNDLDRRNGELSEHAQMDMVAAVRQYLDQDLGYLFTGLPRLEEVSFDDAAEFETCVRRYLAHPDLRSQIRCEQARFVQEHCTYGGGLRRVLRQMASLIAQESIEPAAAANPPRLSEGAGAA